jgi:HAD superfamily hydrolase (TIGR01458 family)
VPAAYLFDLDGTLYQGDAPLPGAVELIRHLRSKRIPIRFLTNTTSKPRNAVVARLNSYGFEVEPEEVFTALLAGAQLARALGCRTLMPLVREPAWEDLAGFQLVSVGQGRPTYEQIDAVLVGDLAAGWLFEHLQQAFTALRSGARLIALSKDRCWMTERGLTLDAGPFVAALEYAAEVEAQLAGKPSAAFYQGAVESLALPGGTPPRGIVMVGDDLRGDIEGAQRAGYSGWLVRTGKYQEEALSRSGIQPDRILQSVADLLPQPG